MRPRVPLLFGLALASLVALSACRSDSEGQQRPAAVPVPVKVAKVREGAISSTLAFSGSLQAKDQVELMPSGSGKIEKVFVDVGSAIKRGDPIAQLETDVLRVSLQSAEANLQSAQAQLNIILAGARPEQVAAAKANLEAARVRLRVIQEQQNSTAQAEVARFQARLDDLRAGTKAADLAASKAALDTATANLARDEARLNQLLNPSPADIQATQAALESVRARLSQILNPTPADVQAAEATLETARSTLASAEARMATLDADIAAAQSAVDAAQASVTSEETQYNDLVQPTAADLNRAEADVQAAKAKLEQAQAEYERMLVDINSEEKMENLITVYLDWWSAKRKLEEDLARDAAQAVLDADREALMQATRKVEIAEQELNWTKPGVSAQDYFGTIASLESAKAGLASAQAQLSDLKTPPENDVRAAQASVDSAKANLASAKAKLDTLAGKNAGEALARQAAVDSAKAGVTSAEAKLNQLKHPTPADIQAAEANVASAELKLTQLQNPTPDIIQTARAAVDTSRASMQSAQARWDQLKTGATAAELQAGESDLIRARNGVAQASADAAVQEQQVTQLEQQASLTGNPYTNNDIQRATAGVAVAEAAVEQARLSLNKATVIAPFDAIVAKKYLSEGALASGNSPVVSLVSSSVELTFNVEEAMVGQVRTDQPVSFTVPAYGERPFQGRVSTVAPIADAASRTFAVKVTPTDPEGQLKAGMFANLNVIAANKEKTLLTPRAAVVQRPDGAVVFVVKDGKTEQRKVRLGLTSDNDAEVLEGLAVGDEVVVQGNRTLRGNDTVKVVEDQPAGGQQRQAQPGQGAPGGQQSGQPGQNTPQSQGQSSQR